MNDIDLLEALLEGTAPPASPVPERVDKLAMLADMVGTTLEPTPVMMRSEARSDLRNALIREANAMAAEPAPLLTRIRDGLTARTDRWKYSSRAAVASGTAAMVLSSGGVAAATTAALPGDVFYGLKLATEDALLAFSDGTARGAGLLAQAVNRVDEADLAAERQQMDTSADALRLADEHARDGAQHYLAAYLEDDEQADTAILRDLGDWVITTNRRLDLMTPVTGDATGALADLRTTLNRIGQRVEVLVTNACTSCALGVHDDPDAGDTIARGAEADGTPPTPPSAPLDLTFIPPASKPFQACPCLSPVPPGAATPATTPESQDTNPAPPQDSSGQGPPPSSGGGSGGGGNGGGGTSPLPVPLPVPLPDTGPVAEQVPDPVRQAIEEVIEQIPADPGPGAAAPGAPGSP